MEKLYKRALLLGVMVLFWVPSLFSQGIDTLWTKTFGGTGNDWGCSVKQTTDGGYIVAGYTSSFGAGSTDVYLIRTDSNGDTLWTMTYGGSGNEKGHDVIETDDGGFIAVGEAEDTLDPLGSRDLLIVKTDSSGNLLWSKTYGYVGQDWYSDDIGYSICEATDGGYVIAGKTDGRELLTQTYLWLVKIDEGGDTLWTNYYSAGDDYSAAYSLTTTPQGGYILVGENAPLYWWKTVAAIKTDSAGSPVWEENYGGDDWGDAIGYSVTRASDNGYVITGRFGWPDTSVLLFKINESGDTVWAKSYDGSVGRSVQKTMDGGYALTGIRDGDVYLLRTVATGDSSWAKSYGGANSDGGYSIQQTIDGGYIVAGYTSSFGAGGNDVYLIKTTVEPTQIGEEKPSKENFRPLLIEPNPFSDRALIQYSLLEGTNVQIVIYNVMGQSVRTLINKREEAGMQTVVWDGRDEKGESVSRGVYFLKLRAGKFNISKKFLRLK